MEHQTFEESYPLILDDKIHTLNDMLPVKSGGAKISLMCLTPASVQPHRFSKATAPVEYLSQIEHIRINETILRDNVTYYVIDIFFQHHENRIPTNKHKRKGSPRVREDPDVRIERRYSEFIALRQSIYLNAQLRHRMWCNYCGAICRYIMFSIMQPRFVTKIGTSAHVRTKILTKFTSKVVELVRKWKDSNGGRWCEGYEYLPSIVERFIRDDLPNRAINHNAISRS
jgi:hypothetical protein